MYLVLLFFMSKIFGGDFFIEIFNEVDFIYNGFYDVYFFIEIERK